MLNAANYASADVLTIPVFEDVVQENIALLQTILPDYEPLESDLYLPLIQSFSYREIHLHQLFNNKLKSLLLHFAKGNNLDLIANDRYHIERLDDEDDIAFLFRILASLDGYSTAGSLESYEFHARSVSAVIDDVKAVSPIKGVIDVFIASYDEEITDALVEKVTTAVNVKKVRPATDEVYVKVATVKPVVISGTVELFDINSEEAVKAAIAKNFDAYFKVRQALPYSDVITKLKVDGVYDVAPTSPTQNIYCADGERIVIDTSGLVFTQAVLEDD